MRKVFSVSFVLLIIVTLQAQTQKTTAGSNNDVLPNVYSLKLTDMNNKSFDLQTLKGSYLLISFGATWCKPCHEELRALEDVKKEYKDKPVKFIWVSIDEKDISNKVLTDFAKTINFTFPILRDPKSEAYLKYTNRYRLPTILFVKPDGTVVAPVHFGMFPTAEEYKKHMRKRLNAIMQTDTKP